MFNKVYKKINENNKNNQEDILMDINDVLLELNEDQLLSLNLKIIERIKLIRRARSNVSMAKFNLGDAVYFNRDGDKIRGRIIRLNQKTISIITSDNHPWNVSPSFLTKIIER